MLLQLVLALATIPSPDAPAIGDGAVTTLLCTHRIVVETDGPAYIRIRSMTLNRYRLTVDVEYGLRMPSSWATPAMTGGVGFQLDAAPVLTIPSLVKGNHETLALSFYGLARGSHRIRIGFAQLSGDLALSNSFCFAAPGHFALKGDFYL